jgi:hypothetical protein
MAIEAPAVEQAKSTNKGKLAAGAAALTAILLAVAGIFEAYTKAIEAVEQAVQASKVATAASAAASAEPVAANGYEELAKKVEELSTQQVAMHDDVVSLRGYLDGLAHAQGAGANVAGGGGGGRALPPGRAGAGGLAVPTIKAAPTFVRPLPVSEIRKLKTPPQ